MSDYTILLIDYEPRSIAKIQGALVPAGFRIEVAKDGLAGIQAFKDLSPDLVLIEAMIPKKHGFEVCQELKATPEGKKTPIAIITAVYKGRRYRTQAIHLYGCDHYIEKPLEDQELLQICRTLLNLDETTPVTETTPADRSGSQGDAGTETIPAATSKPEAKPKPVAAAPVPEITEKEIDDSLESLVFETKKDDDGRKTAAG